MHAALPFPAPEPPAARPLWRRTLDILAINIAFWTVLSAVGALTSLGEDLRHGVRGDYALIFLSWARTSLVLAGLCLVLHGCLSRWPGIVANARSIAAGYVLTLLVLLPLQLVFLARLYLPEDGASLTWKVIERQVEAVDKFASVLGLSSITAVYFAMVAIKVWQQSQLRAQAWAQANADALAMRSELERQRGLALRAQLEPHFMFNALNAIGALVRSSNNAVALDGIADLSELLRYALRAGERSWVKLGEELAFVEQYLALQGLRYGARLRIVIDPVDADALDCDCPPLLLQPLVENALRHDLDCHEGSSDIHVSLARRDRQLHILVSNCLHAEVAHNPGVGLGLRNIAARLQLAYGAAANMRQGACGGRFEVAIRIPDYAPE